MSWGEVALLMTALCNVALTSLSVLRSCQARDISLKIRAHQENEGTKVP
jgi:hypothetical protein